MKRLFALLALTVFFASTAAFACDGADSNTSTEGSKPTTDRQA